CRARFRRHQGFYDRRITASFRSARILIDSCRDRFAGNAARWAAGRHRSTVVELRPHQLQAPPRDVVELAVLARDRLPLPQLAEQDHVARRQERTSGPVEIVRRAVQTSYSDLPAEDRAVIKAP